MISTVILLAAASQLPGQDVLSGNPELWGLNAHSSANGGMGQSPESQQVVAAAQLSGILKAAQRAENQGVNADAVRLYQQALQLAPTDRTTLISFARMLHRAGDLDNSIATYYRSLEFHRDDPVAMNDLALCYARKGELRHALAMMEGAVSLNPDSKRYRNNMAKVLLELGRSNDAFSHLVAAAGPAIGHYNMGQLLSQRGDTAEAIQFLEIAISMNPTLEPAIDLLQQIRSASNEVVSNPVATASGLARLPSTQSGQALDPALAGTAAHASVEANEYLGSPASYPESQQTFSSRTAKRPDVERPWVPGSIKLQSAELDGGEYDSREPDGNGPTNGENVDWAMGFDELVEHDATAAPIPFDNRPRRYTKSKTESDAVGSFLDGFPATTR